MRASGGSGTGVLDLFTVLVLQITCFKTFSRFLVSTLHSCKLCEPYHICMRLLARFDGWGPGAPPQAFWLEGGSLLPSHRCESPYPSFRIYFSLFATKISLGTRHRPGAPPLICHHRDACPTATLTSLPSAFCRQHGI